MLTNSNYGTFVSDDTKAQNLGGIKFRWKNNDGTEDVWLTSDVIRAWSRALWIMYITVASLVIIICTLLVKESISMAHGCTIVIIFFALVLMVFNFLQGRKNKSLFPIWEKTSYKSYKEIHKVHQGKESSMSLRVKIFFVIFLSYMVFQILRIQEIQLLFSHI